MLQGVRVEGWRAALAAVILCGSAPAGLAQPKIQPLADQAEILRRFPEAAGVVEHGVRLHLKTGDWTEIIDNPFGPDPPTLCWYAPELHVAGVCQSGRGVTVTILVELNTGRRASAPGLPALMPEPNLIVIGPDPKRGADSDSLTLVKVQPDDLIDEGGADFDENYGPGRWVDGDCYRLTPKAAKTGAWLERTSAGWRQTPAAKSTVCQKRHGR